jgi:hypothetical protein
MAYSGNKNYSQNNPSSSYIVPRRMIITSPYVSYIYANDLFPNAVKDQSGWGGGLNIRVQVYQDFGFILDGLYTNLKVVNEEVIFSGPEDESDLVAIISGGFFYSFYNNSYADIRVDLCYGAITAGNDVMTIFIPGVEAFRKVYDRLILFTKLSWLITNDWIVNQDYKEHYTSFSLSAGFSIIF